MGTRFIQRQSCEHFVSVYHQTLAIFNLLPLPTLLEASGGQYSMSSAHSQMYWTVLSGPFNVSFLAALEPCAECA